jgi:hypothetical protein
MNLSIEEQIEYMRGEVAWYSSKDRRPGHSLTEELVNLQAILATLEAVRDGRKGHGPIQVIET